MSYVEMVLTYTNGSYTTYLLYLFLTFARIAPIVAITPFLGAKLVPMVGRAGFGIILAIFFVPISLPITSHFMIFSWYYVLLLSKEVIIGILLAILSLIPFLTAQTTGSIIDFQRGSSMMMAQDITMQVQSSPIGLFYNYFLIALFFLIGGPLIFFDTIGSTFSYIPIDQLIPPAFYSTNNPVSVKMMGLLGGLFDLAIRLGAPPILSILMTEVFLGIANRLAPQVQIAFLGMPLKSFVGLLILMLAWAAIFNQLTVETTTWFKDIKNLIKTVPLFPITS